MKKINTLLLLLLSYIVSAQVTISPATFDVDEEITVTVDLSQAQCNTIPTTASKVYMHSGIGNDGNPWGFSVVGNWGQDDGVGEMTSQGNGIFSITITPSTYYSLNATQIANATRMGMVFRSANGNQEMKDPPTCSDFFFNVGSFQLTLMQPSQTSTIVESGSNFNIVASTSLAADFSLEANGTVIHTQNNTTSYSHNLTINEDINFSLTATQTGGSNSQSVNFFAVLTPNPSLVSLPSGLKDGVNFDPNNPDEITLVLYAPGKEFVHVASNLADSDYQINNTYLMNIDTSNDRHWITIDLSNHNGDHFLYEYVIENSFRVPDPYSQLSINQFNDPFIMTRGVFPGIPSFPTDKTSNILTWVRLNQPAYQWQVENFQRPDQEDLVIYELLVRDFDELQSFDAVVDRLDYLEGLGINAIELMPVSEFDNNDSWGYNPSLHMSLDKYYGSPESFKAFVDECHARGIAVILDVVYNHGTGQSPYFRMYNDCNGCFGGNATANNPIHAQFDPNPVFSFFEKIDHNKFYTHEWLDNMNRYWLDEYKIDGYRFDFTKGFTMTPGDGGAFDQPRINNLIRMYNEIREVDETAYVILEHFAPDNEEQVLVNHRFDGSNPNENGMLTWGNVNFNYNQATMGYDNSNFSRVTYRGRNNGNGWSPHSVIGYMESHDEERLMFKNLEFGNSSGGYDITQLNTALERMELAGAFYFTAPGPKMIWQFGEVGYDYSINHCPDGTINNDCRTAVKPIRWDYVNDANRMAIYDTWKKLIQFKKQDPIFKSTNFTLEVANDVEKKIFVVNDNAAEDEIRYVTVVGNFGVNSISTQPFFQESGTWYNALEGTPFEVTNTNMSISLEPGEFIVFANNLPETPLSVEDFNQTSISLYPNPSIQYFALSAEVERVEIFDINGRRVKDFRGNFLANDKFSIEDLNTGMYIVRIQNGRSTETFKLMKNN
jgi:glycosidase